MEEKDLTQEEVDKAMPPEEVEAAIGARARVGEEPLVSEDDIKELPQFQENDVIDCGGFSFEVTRVLSNNRYYIKVVD